VLTRSSLWRSLRKIILLGAMFLVVAFGILGVARVPVSHAAAAVPSRADFNCSVCWAGVTWGGAAGMATYVYVTPITCTYCNGTSSLVTESMALNGPSGANATIGYEAVGGTPFYYIASYPGPGSSPYWAEISSVSGDTYYFNQFIITAATSPMGGAGFVFSEQGYSTNYSVFLWNSMSVSTLAEGLMIAGNSNSVDIDVPEVWWDDNQWQAANKNWYYQTDNGGLSASAPPYTGWTNGARPSDKNPSYPGGQLYTVCQYEGGCE
jgi:hypothetical protein